MTQTKQKPKIFFSCSIAGGREYKEYYKTIVRTLKDYGEVLTGFFADDDELNKFQGGMNNNEIFLDDIERLTKSTHIVSEVSVPSLGVGYECCEATHQNKPYLALYHKNSLKKLSAMIRGNTHKKLTVIEYENLESLEGNLRDYCKNNLIV